MGQSSAPITQIAGLQKYEPTVHNPFDATGFKFLVDRRGDKVFHREIRSDRQGKKTEFETEVRYAIGSGTRGRSYVIDYDGYLFQSAISWYDRQEIWDLSPGFAANPHSDKMITAECLFCHCNFVESVEHSLNHFREPVFRAYTIGCERCHGPGELHVKRRSESADVTGVDTTVVNPAHLDWQLREAVCQQCHLQGQKRILKRGRRPFDFRPGLPFTLFWSVFVEPSDKEKELRAVGQVEQMYASRCFRASEGKLGCISCHDAHAKPAAVDRSPYYRSRCLQCHTGSSCKLTVSDRVQKSKEDSCITCHMPRIQSSDVAHTAVTDHRIRRKEVTADLAASPGKTVPAPPEPASNPLVLFRYDWKLHPDEDSSRDWGVALTKLGEAYQKDGATRKRIGNLALPVLETAVRTHPDDVVAHVAKGNALWLLDRPSEALAAFEAALAVVPQREDALASAAALTGEQGRYEEAINKWRQTIAINPWVARYHNELAKLLVIRGNWPDAVAESERAIRLHPFHLEARQTLVFAYLQQGRKEQAREEFQRLLSLDPPNAEALRHLFEPRLR
jgi:Flp pilus assembly protein TadD